jgi:multiple sugar transport system ATP-binding protein
VTSLYVTHDQVEAMTLADRMVVMNARRGRADRHPPLEVYESGTRTPPCRNAWNEVARPRVGCITVGGWRGMLEKGIAREVGGEADCLPSGPTCRMSFPLDRVAPHDDD